MAFARQPFNCKCSAAALALAGFNFSTSQRAANLLESVSAVRAERELRTTSHDGG